MLRGLDGVPAEIEDSLLRMLMQLKRPFAESEQVLVVPIQRHVDFGIKGSLCAILQGEDAADSQCCVAEQ